MEASVHNDVSNIAKIISQAVPAEKIYLFGSYAYGQPRKESDYDFYVIIPDDSMRPIVAMQQAQQAIAIHSRRTIAIDVLASNKTDFDKRRMWLNTVEKDVDQKGLLLYERHYPSI